MAPRSKARRAPPSVRNESKKIIIIKKTWRPRAGVWRRFFFFFSPMFGRLRNRFAFVLGGCGAHHLLREGTAYEKMARHTHTVRPFAAAPDALGAFQKKKKKTSRIVNQHRHNTIYFPRFSAANTSFPSMYGIETHTVVFARLFPTKRDRIQQCAASLSLVRAPPNL